MEDSITIYSQSKNFASSDDIVLDDTPRTQIIVRAGIHDEGIRGELIRYRKGEDGKREKPTHIHFNSLHENDTIKISLSTNALRTLHEKLHELDQILENQGVQAGVHDYKFVDSGSLVVDDKNKASIIKKILDADFGIDVWEQIIRNNSDLATQLANAKIHDDRLSVANTFAEMLENEHLTEGNWQSFFENNTWIFGYGLRYQFLRIIQAQPNYGGAAIDGSGGQRGDYLASTEAEVKYTCLVEIKKPTTALLQSRYRNGAWRISDELAGAIAQVQANCAQWEISGSRTDQNRELLQSYYTISPKGIVVIGNTNELDSLEKRNSFERFRREIRCPEIITYDELHARIRFLVGDYPEPDNDEAESETSSAAKTEEFDDELPF